MPSSLVVLLLIVGASASYLPVPLNTFSGAEKYCQSFGGHLASIHSAFDNQAVTSFVKQQGYPAAFIGLQLQPNGQWTYTDGTTKNYVNWALNNPTSDNCTTVGPDGYWYSVRCVDIDTAVCYIVDIPTPPTVPPVATSRGPITYQCPPGWSYFATTGACYWVGYNATVIAARSTCQQMGSDLASIHSAEENGFVLGLAFHYTTACWQPLPYYYSVWIGGIGDNGYNYWSDGTPFNYANMWGHQDGNIGNLYISTQSGCADFAFWRVVNYQTPTVTGFVCKKFPA
ncbi:unnamed protein product, partial [Mesorhabditis spiculigera]